jgi:transcriptional regulator GlxA family with amidase domain
MLALVRSRFDKRPVSEISDRFILARVRDGDDRGTVIAPRSRRVAAR